VIANDIVAASPVSVPFPGQFTIVMATVPVLGPDAVLTLSGLKVQQRITTSCVEIRSDAPFEFGPPIKSSPGAL
jgi:hypothetical protein